MDEKQVDFKNESGRFKNKSGLFEAERKYRKINYLRLFAHELFDLNKI